MKEEVEKFTIRMTDKGMTIRDRKGQTLCFTASDALMLLDILSNEEGNLRRLAQESTPLPITIHPGRHRDDLKAL